MKAGYPLIDIKLTDRIAYYNAFDEYHVKCNLGAMEKLFAGYVKARLDSFWGCWKNTHTSKKETRGGESLLGFFFHGKI